MQAWAESTSAGNHQTLSPSCGIFLTFWYSGLSPGCVASILRSIPRPSAHPVTKLPRLMVPLMLWPPAGSSFGFERKKHLHLGAWEV